ncbi:hypothetical protein OH540_21205 [Streptomyces sp. BPPL-273]|uniref:hypothetical protein n=1 Tax=Streptomyces sp. BPPL-273 TaxID=2987533 RepID=UPI0024AEE9CA|nr:hypothetical protein [Streptomyces sp. BPPL-273]WHM32424.1 hypothetical protein OH540_21205 [Streptomyces sp. BPPL-273]
MDPKPWRERIAEEEQLLEQLRSLSSDAATRRAQALRDGVAELGTIAAVARDLGRSWQAVDQAIKRDEKKAPRRDATTE